MKYGLFWQAEACEKKTARQTKKQNKQTDIVLFFFNKIESPDLIHTNIFLLEIIGGMEKIVSLYSSKQ